MRKNLLLTLVMIAATFILGTQLPLCAQQEAAAAAEQQGSAELRKLFGKSLRNANGKKVTLDALDNKVIGIYFSAHWCPPCRVFTPQLVKAYNELTAAGKPFEIVLVSSDQSKAAMQTYMKETTMPWVALPFGAKEGQTLKEKFGINGIPSLVIINAKGETVTTTARNDIAIKGAAAFDAWQ